MRFENVACNEQNEVPFFVVKSCYDKLKIPIRRNVEEGIYS